MGFLCGQICVTTSKYVSWGFLLAFFFLFCDILVCLILFYYYFLDACLYPNENKNEKMWISVNGEVRMIREELGDEKS